MKSRVQRWGNSLAVRIPKIMADEIDLEENAEIDLVQREGALVISRARQRKYTFDELVDAITRENVHEFVDHGVSVGAEIIP